MLPKKTNKFENLAHQLIFRKLASAKEKRFVLSRVKLENKNYLYPAISKSISSHRQLLSTLVVSDFPAFNKIKKIPPLILQKGSLEDELIWAASVLSIYKDELESFAKLKNEYYELLYCKDLNSALERLNEIESKFGYSLWLVRSKIYCIFIKDGAIKQQEYVENIIENNQFQNDFELQFIIHYSNAIEENKEYEEYKDSIKDIYRNLNIDYERLSHNLYRLAPDEVLTIKNYDHILSQEEVRTIIDRFETFTFALISSIAKGLISELVIDRLKKILNIKNEKIIQNCYSFFENMDGYNNDDFYPYNEYTKGNYTWFLNNSIENLNLTASALANLDKNLEEVNLKNKIINSIKNVLNNVNQKSEINFLKKHIALNFGNIYCYQILILLNEFNNEDIENFENILFLNKNPKTYLRLIKEGDLDANDLNNNISLSLLNSLKLNSKDLLNNIKDLIPCNRFYNYLGIIALNESNYDYALELFKKNEVSLNNYIRRQAKVNIFNTYLKANYSMKTLEFFAEEIINSGSIDNRIDALLFFKENYTNEKLLENINFSILVDYLKKNKLIDPIFDINLADLLDYVLISHNIDSPIELFDFYEENFDSSVKYYLKNICTLSVIDSLPIYSSLDEVELLRIQICQKLVDFDFENSKQYRTEIAQITKNLEVSRLFKVVETGRIFVDTESLKSIVFESVSRGLDKCKESLKIDDHTVNQRLKEILNSLYKDQYPQLKNVYLPKNELEEYYFSISRNVIDEFYFNPAYGLDTHISTAIRHGWLEGYLTKPFIESKILFELIDGHFKVNEYWENISNSVNAKFKKEIQRDLIALNRKIHEGIRSYLNKKLQFDSIDGGEKNSLFNIFWTKDQHDEVVVFIKEETLAEELIEKIFLICRNNLERDLHLIRDDIDKFSEQIIGQLDRIYQKMVRSIDRNLLSDHLYNIIQARESFHEKMQTIKSWFYISTDLGLESFPITHAVSVCIKQIENCFGTGKPIINFIDNAEHLSGKYFEGLCKILFLLGEFKHEVRQFEKSYDNQQAEQISLMV
ncbi:hypothetical protein [Acinetobacter baumannii]|uniref:hypothetical protein n=1 Tax=Acinetobacter baumannii TaxID=470 RepID=UPI003D2FC49A